MNAARPEARAPIRRLDEATAAQIRAGEVIERPVSALKEILENSLDAGARRIEIGVCRGLEHDLEVSDDGAGIPRAEVLLALEPHATSKLAEINDLQRLATLGFRGEALPAIARAARVTLTTRTPEETEGSTVTVEGGEAGPVRPLGRPVGTTLTVRDLFFNVPARRKFLRSTAGDLRAAARLVSAYAIAFPEVAFRFTVDGRERFAAAPARTLAERVAAVFGQRFLDQCLLAEAERPGVRVTVLLGVPELARVTREAQIFLVNRRWVQSPLLSQAVRHAYGNLIPPGRHPACIVDLRVDPAIVDVNVHPTKREVRFASEDLLFGFLAQASAQPLARLTPRYDAGAAGADESPSLVQWVRDAERQMPLWGAREAAGDAATDRPAAPGAATPGTAALGAGFFPRAAAGVGPAEALGPGERPRFANLWQLHDTYILAPVSGGLVIVDQHAAHERVLYEEALERMRGHAATAQQILFSQIIDLTRAEFELVVDVLEPLSRLGFDLAPISPPSVLLRGVPAGLSGREPVQLLRDLLDGIGEESGRQLPDDELTDRLAKSYACHAAVRAGQALSLEEMNHLVDRLFATSLPHGDPHGRPSFVRLDLRELHARFGRGAPTD
jgi:DNA mismatch repair protein MutL